MSAAPGRPKQARAAGRSPQARDLAAPGRPEQARAAARSAQVPDLAPRGPARQRACRWSRRAALAALPFVAAACARSDPERELRETIDRMARAIETREPADFLDGLADDFTRESGAFGKQDARRLLAGVLLRNERITLAVAVTGVALDGERAQAELRVFAAGSSGGLLPERGQTWNVRSHWRREGGRWRMFNADWQDGL